MMIFKMRKLKTSIACLLAGILLAPGAEASSMHRARGQGIGVNASTVSAQSVFRDELIAAAIANGASPYPGPLYGRYLGYYGYPGHYPCCYYAGAYERAYNPYLYAYRTGHRQPTWWDYPDHWRGWAW